MFCFELLGGDFSDHELVVTRKYVSETQFRIYSESLKSGFAYDTTVSHGFYDVVHTGDRIRSPLRGYLKLIRDGQTIGRYFSDDFVFLAIYTLVGLFPLVVYIKPETLPFRKVVFPVMAVLEGVIISLFFIGLFSPI